MKLKGLKNGEMLIGGWVAPLYGEREEENFLTAEAFSDVGKSGLNTVYTCGCPRKDFGDVRRAADCAGRVGVKLIVSAECLRNGLMTDEECRNFISFCRQSESVIGLNVFDEPQAKHFKALKELFEKFGELFGDLLFYVNMLPVYAPAEAFRREARTEEKRLSVRNEYTDFLREYLNMIRPPVLSYDFYPFRFEKGVCDPDYFFNLSVCARCAKEMNIPLWDFIQVTSWNRESIRNMTYSEIRWQVSVSVAYGVTGIQYFCYWTPRDGDGETFMDAMVDRKGNRTKSWYFVRDVNRHLRAIEKYILAAEHKGVIAVGDTSAPVPEVDQIKTYGNLCGISADGALIGCFLYRGKNMYYAANTSVWEERVLSLSFSSVLKFRLVRGERAGGYVSDKFEEVLHPGEGVLLAEV